MIKQVIKENNHGVREVILAAITFFRQIAQFLSNTNRELYGGNIDPYYLLAFGFFIDKKNKKKDIQLFLIFFTVLLFYSAIQILVMPEIDLGKMLVNLLKIYICFAVMLFVKNNGDKIDFKKVLYCFSVLLAFFTLIAVTLGKSSTVFWRFNDFVNIYTKTRLKLFFLEPSELGYTIAIIMIFLVFYLMKSTEAKERINLLLCILANSIALILAKPMGAIAILVVSIVLMVVIDFCKTKNKSKRRAYLACLTALIIVIFIMIKTNNPIVLRIKNTLIGNDPSNQYRVGVTYDVFAKSFIDYNCLGCGFGNLNTERFMSNYNQLVTVVVNSFIYFFIETGVFGILMVLVLMILLLKRTIKSKSLIKWGLLVFVFIYQFFGSHFTNGLTWFIYGLILSKYETEREEISGKE